MSEPAAAPTHVPPDLGTSMVPPTVVEPAHAESLFTKRFRKFRRLKRGYYSFIAVLTAYVISFFLPLIANNIALVVKYNGA